MRTEASGWNRLCTIAVLSIVAVAAWVRFKGIGVWPFATDEFLTAASIRHIVHSGVPAFPSGGYYLRGLPYQYLAGGLIALGIEPEASLRSISAICGLLALLPLYLLARRVSGRVAAVSAVVLVAFSIWEIEFSRFGRMYSMFQAVFLWYLWTLTRTVADSRRSLLPLLYALSLLGVTVWEGGIALLLLNFVPHLRDRPRLQSLRDAIVPVALLMFGAAYLATDFRQIGAGTTLPPGFVFRAQTLRHPLEYARHLWRELAGTPLWLAAWGLLALLGSAGWALLLRRERERPMLLLAYGLLLAAALMHFVMAIPLIAVCALLLGWIPARDGSRRHNLIPLTIVGIVTALSTLFWLGFAYFQAPAGTGQASVLEMVRPAVVAMLKFPNVVETIVYPWATTLPVLSILFAIAFLGAFVISLTDHSAAADLRVWCLATMIVIGVTATAPVKYHEIRYSYVLLPLGYLVLACLIPLCLQGFLRAPRVRAAVQLMLVPALMAVSDDHHYDHLLRVDSADYNFRLHLPDAKTAMYYMRLDYRTPATFINQHLRDGDRVVIFPSAAQPYVARLDAIFRDPAALEFPEISCRAGTVERWTNAPMITSSDKLADFIRETAGATWIIVSDEQWQMYGRLPESHRLERCASGIDGALLTLRVCEHQSPGSGTQR